MAKQKQNTSELYQTIMELNPAVRELALGLYHNIVFMAEELSSLRAEIKKTGWTEGYQNGQYQHGVKLSACGQAYNSLIKQYKQAIDSLAKMLPEDRQDELHAWLSQYD